MIFQPRGGTVEGQVVQLDMSIRLCDASRTFAAAICDGNMLRTSKATRPILWRIAAVRDAQILLAPPSDISVCNTVVHIPDYGENGGSQREITVTLLAAISECNAWRATINSQPMRPLLISGNVVCNRP